MGLTNTESVSKHKVQFSWPRKLRILCTLSWWAKCLVTWYGHSYLSTATCYRLAGAGVLLPSAAKSALSSTLDTTTRCITHTEPMPFLSRCKPLPCLWANLLGSFHCDHNCQVVCYHSQAGSASCHVSPPRLLSGDWALARARDCDCLMTDVACSPLSGITNQWSRPQIQDICKPSTCSKTWRELTCPVATLQQNSVQQNSIYLCDCFNIFMAYNYSYHSSKLEP